ncbi:MAG: hypothetical protein JKY66_01825 [Spongiibacteraceae bacterium]|nr:hypothetical protein [Spongiibacteraceae bacterium]
MVDAIPLLKSSVYQMAGSSVLPHHPALLGGQCRCGYTFFPMQQYGCEQCGSEQLKTKTLTGRGTLLAVSTVYIHLGKRPTPYKVVSVVLDDGPVVRTLLAENQPNPKPGQTMTTTLVQVTDPKTEQLCMDLRFQCQQSGVNNE